MINSNYGPILHNPRSQSLSVLSTGLACHRLT